ncbi:MAG: DUF4468 domain-containing protein [Bacteroidetes bacterium]|nr:DUF4468 domain-containing protein [Bacteroidota bacterium]
MNKLLIIGIVLTSICISAFAQKTTVTVPKLPIDTVTKKYTYTEVVQQKGTKDTLFNRAIHWIGIYFKNAQDVTDVRDKENGKIKGIYRFKIYNTPLKDGTKIEAGIISFTFNIELKENRYRYKITDLNKKGPSYNALEKWIEKSKTSPVPEMDSYITQIDQYMQDFIKSMKKGMTEAVKVKDEW